MGAPAPAPAKPGIISKILSVAAWSKSPEGRKDIGALIAACTAIYVAGHRLGLY
jgi:hypothetical protein